MDGDTALVLIILIIFGSFAAMVIVGSSTVKSDLDVCLETCNGFMFDDKRIECTKVCVENVPELNQTIEDQYELQEPIATLFCSRDGTPFNETKQEDIILGKVQVRNGNTLGIPKIMSCEVMEVSDLERING